MSRSGDLPGRSQARAAPFLTWSLPGTRTRRTLTTYRGNMSWSVVGAAVGAVLAAFGALGASFNVIEQSRDDPAPIMTPIAVVAEVTPTPTTPAPEPSDSARPTDDARPTDSSSPDVSPRPSDDDDEHENDEHEDDEHEDDDDDD